MESFRQKKYSNEAEEIASLNMGARNQHSSVNFLGGYIEGISRYIDRKFLWVISTLLFLVAGKASRVLVDR